MVTLGRTLADPPFGAGFGSLPSGELTIHMWLICAARVCGGASRDRMQYESLPQPVTTAPAAIKPVYRRGRHGSSKPRLVSVLVSPQSATVHRWSPDRVRSGHGR